MTVASDDEAQNQVEPVSDGSGDLIVGTIRPPGWIARIPTLAWFFAGLAALDAGYRIWRQLPIRLDDSSPSNLLFLSSSIVAGAATALLPAAVLVGRRSAGRAELWLFQGAVALAIAEQLGLFGREVVQAVAGQPSLGVDEPTGLSDYLVRELVVQVPRLVLQAFGLAKIGLGLGAIPAAGRSLGRVVFAALAGSLAVAVVGIVLTIEVFRAQSPDDTLLLAYDLLIVGLGVAVLALWAWVASIAARRVGRPWGWILLGALMIVLGRAVADLGLLLAFSQAASGDNANTIITSFGLVSAGLSALGAVLLVFGFGWGIEPVDEADLEPPSTDPAPADPIAGSAGV